MRRLIALPALAAAALLTRAPGTGVGAAPVAAFVPPAAEAALAGQVAAERMQRTVHDLVDIGPRMGGTPSGERAAAYLAAALTAAGLAVQTFDDPPQLAHWEDAWSVEAPTGRRVASAYPYGFSPSIAATEAPLVAVGADLAAGLAAGDRRGTIVFTTGEVAHAYAQITASAASAGSAASTGSAGSGSVGLPLAILTSYPADGRHYLDAAQLHGLSEHAPRPVPVFAVSYRDGEALAALAAGATGQAAKAKVSLHSTIRQGRPRTVLATLAGDDAAHYYLICAHGDSDSGGPGADDNASGEAVVLELARNYADLVRTGKLPRPKVSLRFVVWGSEYASSSAYVAREGEGLRRCLGVINLDEVGTGAEREAIYFESNEVPWNRRLLRTFDRVGADYLGRPGYWPEYTTNPSQGGTDSYAFLPPAYQGELAGSMRIPATTVYTAAWEHLARLPQTPGWESAGTPNPREVVIDYSRYYHSSGDTPANTTDRKPQAMVRAARAIGIALLRLQAADKTTEARRPMTEKWAS